MRLRSNFYGVCARLRRIVNILNILMEEKMKNNVTIKCVFAFFILYIALYVLNTICMYFLGFVSVTVKSLVMLSLCFFVTAAFGIYQSRLWNRLCSLIIGLLVYFFLVPVSLYYSALAFVLVQFLFVLLGINTERSNCKKFDEGYKVALKVLKAQER